MAIINIAMNWISSKPTGHLRIKALDIMQISI